MKKLLFAALLLFSVGASAATVEYKDANVTIQLYDTPCVSKPIVAEFPKELIDASRAAKVVYQGHVLEACWQENVAGGTADIVDEDIDIGQVPMQFFKVVPAI